MGRQGTKETQITISKQKAHWEGNDNFPHTALVYREIKRNLLCSNSTLPLRCEPQMLLFSHDVPSFYHIFFPSDFCPQGGPVSRAMFASAFPFVLQVLQWRLLPQNSRSLPLTHLCVPPQNLSLPFRLLSSSHL